MRKAEKVNVVLGVETGDGRPEEHGLVIRICEYEEYVMLFVVGHSFFVDINKYKGEYVEAEKKVLEG